MSVLLGTVELPPGYSEKNDVKNRILQRIGWSVIALDENRLHTVELHLTEAIETIQKLKRMEEGNG